MSPPSTPIKRNLPLIPSENCTPTHKDFQRLYYDTKRRFHEYASHQEEKLSELNKRYEHLMGKCDSEIQSSKHERSEREEKLHAEIKNLKSQLSRARRFTKKRNCKLGTLEEDEDEKKLYYQNCKKLFRYSCTGLPLYQLSQFMIKGYRKCICANCTDIPEYTQNALAAQEPHNDVGPDPKLADANVQMALDSTNEELQKLLVKHEDVLRILHETRGKLSKANEQLHDSREETKEIDHLSFPHNSEVALRSLPQRREDELDVAQMKLNAVEQPPDGDKEKIHESLLDDKKKLRAAIQKIGADLKRIEKALDHCSMRGKAEESKRVIFAGLRNSKLYAASTKP